MSPLFSIIIPVYQCERTLDRCIDSVISQDKENYEIILVDDGSSDKSGKICDRYAELFSGKITVIHKKNEGPLFARLDGIELAKGQYYLFLDADDIFINGNLRLLEQTIKQTQADLIIMNYYRVCSDGSEVMSEPLYANNAIFENENQIRLQCDIVKDDTLNALWQKCVHHSLLDDSREFRKYGKMILGEDKIISLHLIDHAKRIVYLADGLYGYYSNRESITHKRTVKHYQDVQMVNDITAEYIQHWNLGVTALEINCKNRLEFAIGCLYSVCDLQKKRPAFNELYNQISIDEELQWAYRFGARRFPVRKRLAVFLLSHRMKYLLYAYIRGGVMLRKVYS